MASVTIPVTVAYSENYVKISTSTDGKNFTLYDQVAADGATETQKNEVFAVDERNSTLWVRFEMLVNRATSVTLWDARIDGIYVTAGD